MEEVIKKNFNAVREALTADRNKIDQLHKRIEALEAQNQQKNMEIDQLRQQMFSFIAKLGNIR